jgi:hypothetical protein
MAPSAPWLPKASEIPTALCIDQTKNSPIPWLSDTTALVGDLDYVRELILKIPQRGDETWLPVRTAIAALWELRQRLFELTAMQKERQRQWQKRGHDAKRRQKQSAPNRHGKWRLSAEPRPIKGFPAPRAKARPPTASAGSGSHSLRATVSPLLQECALQTTLPKASGTMLLPPEAPSRAVAHLILVRLKPGSMRP